MIRITSWEFEELLDHLKSRPDIWNQNEEDPSIWLRVRDYNVPCYAIALGLPQEGSLGLREVTFYPLEWPEDECERYTRDLVSHWTDYGSRIRIETFLRDGLGHDAETAEVAALALAAQDYRTGPDPEESVPPIQEPLWPAGFIPPPVIRRQDPTHVGIWAVVAGAYSQRGTLQLRTVGGQLAVSLSLPSPFGGNTPVLKGFVHPVSGNIQDSVRKLRGEDNAEGTLETDSGSMSSLWGEEATASTEDRRDSASIPLSDVQQGDEIRDVEGHGGADPERAE